MLPNTGNIAWSNSDNGSIALVLTRILLYITQHIVGNYKEVHYLPLNRNAGELLISSIILDNV